MKLKYAFQWVLATLSVAFLTGCGGSSDDRSVDPESGRIVRLDRAVAEGEVADSLVAPMSAYMEIMGLGGEDVENAVDAYSKTRAFEVFYPDIEKRLGDIEPIEHSLAEMNDNIISTFTRINPQRFYGIVSPYQNRIITSDSITFIALNHYLGADYEGYASLPDYVRRQKYSKRIPIETAEALVATAYPYQSSDNASLVDRLLYEGALAKAVMTLIPDLTLKDYLGWSDEEMSFAERNEGEIWNVVVLRDYLYSTDPTVADRMIAPSPASQIISPETPARIGRYIGYRIVESYLKNKKDTGIEQLLEPQFYHGSDSFIDAAYVP